MQKIKSKILVSYVTSAILSLMAYLLFKSSSAQMMMSPTPTPSNDSLVSNVLVVITIIVSITIIVIYIFYLKNKNRKITRFSDSTILAVKEKQPILESKIGSNDHVTKPYDIFLCYKKSSGKDYADHLKTGLEELGFHTFQDCRDIPLTVETDEGWACSRDKAVEECKYFILIMTPGFQLSREVIKEIAMARKQGNKTFIYFRHRSMARNIVINLGDELLDVGKLEQVSFESKEELLRLALNIIQKAKNQ